MKKSFLLKFCFMICRLDVKHVNLFQCEIPRTSERTPKNTVRTNKNINGIRNSTRKKRF